MGTKPKKIEGGTSKPIAATPKPRAAAKLKPSARVAIEPETAKPAKVVRTVKRKVTAPSVTLSHEDVALRAYFIAEKRQQLGLPGDSTSDWVQAETELIAERSTTGLN